MPWIDESWPRHAYEALQETLRCDRHTQTEMIQFLLDEGFWSTETLKSFAAAEGKWAACLNPNKPEFFKIGELWALMMRFNRHHMFVAMAADLGYELRRIPTENRRQDLLEQLVVAEERHTTELTRIRSALERLSSPPQAPRAGAVGKFSLVEVDELAPRRGGIACP